MIEFRLLICAALLSSGLLVGCLADDEASTVPAASPEVVVMDEDDRESVEALTAMNAEMRTNESGFITFIDVSERDDVTDATFQYFSGLPQLTELHAIYTNISGSGLQHLSEADDLENLDLYACPITDGSLVHIANLRRLRSLNLIGSKITDDSIPILSQFQNLEYLGMPSQISDAGRARLGEALPNCELD